MAHIEKWIWLPDEKYPENQTTCYAALGEQARPGNYTVAEFFREYRFDEKVEKAYLRFSGDTSFVLYLNDEVLAAGPVNVGGDFLFNEEPRSKHYATRMTVHPDSDTLRFFARVKMMPVAINEYSRGHGGFMLEAKLTLKSGRVHHVTTDAAWLSRLNRAYVCDQRYNQSLDQDAFSQAQEICNIWHTDTAPIPPLEEKIILPVGDREFTVAPGESRIIDVEFDRIYAGYASVNVRAEGEIQVGLDYIETSAPFAHYDLSFIKDDLFRGLQLRSIGHYKIKATNHGTRPAVIAPYITSTCYPVFSCAQTVTDDAEMNRVLDVCRHTLQYCRQMIHLDSPKHSEPLACTGDYYIESLMTAMSFGDMTLAEFDIVRTAEMLRMHDGRMFHTTYSLIWVMMLWDVYMITGNRALLNDCTDALQLLLSRFESYIGENGLIETPPDFMFIDWIYVDEISMHHPPKALGQTCLCAYYTGALDAAEKIWRECGYAAEASACACKAESMRSAMNMLLFDREKQLFFDGLNTPSPEEMLYQYLPQNVEKRYYMPHSNILCALFGVCDSETGRSLIRKAVNDRKWGACQPYFKHFLLEAIFRLGLSEELTLKVIEDWKAPVRECGKGLVEGFIMPEPTYSFDHSHAWGGTPLYSLPKALSGLEIVEPGYKKIRLAPSLLGLGEAHVEIPTPEGTIAIDMKRGCPTIITAPENIVIIGAEESLKENRGYKA